MKLKLRYPYLLGLLLLLVAILVFVAVFKDIRAGSPEIAAVEYARDMKTANFTIYTDTIEAIQRLELGKSVLVLVQYSGFRRGSGAELCEMIMETNRVLFFRWKSTGGSGSCHLINDPGDPLPITVSGGWTSASDQGDGYSLVHGSVRDPQIARVAVTWTDGQVQSAVVKEATYLAVREGRWEMESIAAFDDQNEILYTTLK